MAFFAGGHCAGPFTGAIRRLRGSGVCILEGAAEVAHTMKFHFDVGLLLAAGLVVAGILMAPWAAHWKCFAAAGFLVMTALIGAIRDVPK